MCHETRTRRAANVNPTNDEWADMKEHWNEFSAEAKQHWSEFSTKFSEKFGEHFSSASDRKDNPRLIEVKLPNGRELSFTLGHVIIAALLLWWLPFNLVILAAVVWVAYQVGNSSGEKPKRDSIAAPKRKADEDAGEFDVYRV